MNQTVSFPQAISTTQVLMTKIAAQKLSEAEIEQAITSLILSKNGGRGFFVAYLTSDLTLADNPSPGVIKALKSSLEISSDLLVKNLAMSSAMILTHQRNNDTKQTAGSQTVYQRTTKLIELLESELTKNKLQQLLETIETDQGDYQAFLQRWGYDQEQKQAIKTSIKNCLKTD